MIDHVGKCFAGLPSMMCDMLPQAVLYHMLHLTHHAEILSVRPVQRDDGKEFEALNHRMGVICTNRK